MNKNHVKDIKYVINPKASNNDFNCVRCTFNYNGKTYAKDLMLVKEKGKEDSYYLEQAKDKFEKQISNKKFLYKAVDLSKETNKAAISAVKAPFRLKWPQIVAICGGAAALLAGTGVGFYFLGRSTVQNINNMCTVKFDTGTTGGVFSNGKTNISLNIKKGTKFSEAKTAASTPTLKYHDFDNWYVNETAVSENYVINKDFTVTAKFKTQTCSVSLYAAGNGNGTLGEKDATTLYPHASYKFNRGLSLYDVLNSETIHSITPVIHSSAIGATGEFIGWSIDGCSVADENLQKSTILEDSYITLVAIYKGNVGDTVKRLSATFYGSGDSDVKQSGSWTIRNNEVTEFTMSQAITSEEGISLKNLMDSDEYEDPTGNYAGFDYWYESTDSKKGKVDYEEKFTDAKNFSLNAKYTNHFATDPWRAVINNANLGLPTLKTAYYADIKDKNDSFVGLERKIKMNDDKEYMVTVIGQEYDYGIAYINGEEEAEEGMHVFEFVDRLPLTFQFNTTIDLNFKNFSDLSSGSVIRGWNFTYYYSKSSPVREYLNSTFLENFPEELKNNITSCQKYYQVGFDGKFGADMVSEDKISIPSVMELGFDENYRKNYGEWDAEFIFDRAQDKVYDYYKNNKFLGLSSVDNKYIWLRTLGRHNSYEFYNMYINPSIDNFIRKQNVDLASSNDMSVQPIFCLGHEAI